MPDIENLIKKGNLNKQKLDNIVSKIKHEYWPRLKQKPLPQHCGVCDLFNLCKVVNPKLICPW